MKNFNEKPSACYLGVAVEHPIFIGYTLHRSVEGSTNDDRA